LTEADDKYFETGDDFLKMINPTHDIEACDITLESARYPELTITCEDWLCHIEQEKDSAIVIDKRLTVMHKDEASGHVQLKEVNVPELSMNITGTLAITKLSGASTGTIQAFSGDVWI
jgi:hypothetical protein